MTDFENVISFESLYRAHRRARLGKRHKGEVILFEANLSENLWAMHYDLRYGKFKMGGYHTFMIYDPKEREIQAINYRDRVMQHSLCDNYLMPLLEKRLIYDNAACRKGKGTSFAIKRFREFMRSHYAKHGKVGYFVKCDVSKYFPSIDHDILKEKLSRTVDDLQILKLLYAIIDSYNFDSGKGLPMGNQTSQCFALLYLDELDRYIKEKLKIKRYVRYMDDMLFVVENKAMAEKIMVGVRVILNNNKLKMNSSSFYTAIKNGVHFLGWRFCFGNNGKIMQTLKAASKRRILKRIKSLKTSSVDLSKSLISYQGYLMKGNAFFIQNKLLSFKNT